jgi:methyl acetate hydrolase
MGAAERVREALSEGIEAAALPGVAAAARLPDGEVVEAAVGVRGADNPAPMTPDTQFWIASCTKALTSLGAMQLAEQGLIDLDEPVGPWLPGLARPKLLKGYDDAGKAMLGEAAKVITPRHLLTHTSGLAYGFTSALLDRYTNENGIAMTSLEAPDIPLLFEPGQGWVYGIGIDWTAKLIEAVSGETFDAYMRAHVLGPLGMDDTGFFPTAEQRSRLASMHARLPDGGLAPIGFSMPLTPNFMMGGGGLYSTPRDYLKFLLSMLGDGPQIIGAATLEAFTTVGIEGDEIGVLRSAQPNMSNDFEPFPGARKGWTLGFVANLEPGPDGRSAGSLAWAGLGNCYYWIDREAGAAGIFCAQLLPFADPKTLDVFAAFERAVYGA